jgi:hypothetical protein
MQGAGGGTSFGQLPLNTTAPTPLQQQPSSSATSPKSALSK